MYQHTLISPSILSADFMRLATEVDAIGRAGADWVHFDAIDGVFAPNLTVGVPVLKKLRAFTDMPIDAHLMVCDPLEKLPWFLEHQPDYVTIHWEALDEQCRVEQAHRAASLIRESGAKPGIALIPSTPVADIQETLGLWDMVLVMSVFPGFSGQSYIPESAERVQTLCQMCQHAAVSPRIQVDGGMDAQTAPLVARFGADVIVAGNAVFASRDYASAVDSIRSSADGAHVLEDGQ